MRKTPLPPGDPQPEELARPDQGPLKALEETLRAHLEGGLLNNLNRSASQRRKCSPVGFDVYYFDMYCDYHPDYPLADAEKLELIKKGWDAAVQGYLNEGRDGAYEAVKKHLQDIQDARDAQDENLP